MKSVAFPSHLRLVALASTGSMARYSAAFCATPLLNQSLTISPRSGLCVRRRPRACSESPQKADVPAAPSTPPTTAKEGGSVKTPREDTSPGRASYIEVPGKIKLSPAELADQKAKLDELTLKYRKERIQREYEESRKFGFVRFAETLNGRLAMFFFVVGLSTEYWTGYTIPQQVELLANTLGFF